MALMYQSVVKTMAGGKHVNLRSGPSMECPVIRDIEVGSIADVYMEKDGWVYIRVNGQIGYISADYLDRISQKDSPAPDPITGPPGEWIENAEFVSECEATITLNGKWRMLT